MSFTPRRLAGSRRIAFALAFAATPAAFAGGPTPPVAPLAATAADAALPTDRLIVKYRDGARGAAASAAAADRGALHRTAQDIALRRGANLALLRHGAYGVHVMRMERHLPHAQVEALARELMASDPEVEYAEPDRILQPLLVPNDTQYGQQWHYFEPTAGINLPAAWEKSTGSGVVVAVIDTGYRPHADLAANIVPGYDMIADTFVSVDGNGRDSSALDPGDFASAGACGGGQPVQNDSSSWHGTHVAGTIAALSNNGSGVAGVAFGAKVQPVRALGRCGGYTSDIADGIVWASGGTVGQLPANPTPARVLNLSLGGSGACDVTTQNAINGARGRRAVVVVAAGNSNADAANFSPASCSGVITVAAVNRSGGRAYYSNFGNRVTLAAPGGDTRASAANGILSTLNTGTTVPANDSYAWYQGTSMAAPHVAGVVALMLARNPALTPDDVATRLRATVRPAACTGCGAGLVDANAAVDAAGGAATPTPPTVAEVEPNDASATAQSVPRPGNVTGRMGSTTDSDYFRVAVPAGQSLAVSLAPVTSADYDLYVYNAASTLIARSENGTGAVDRATVTNTGSASANYTVRVRYFSGTSGSAGTYTLSLR